MKILDSLKKIDAKIDFFYGALFGAIALFFAPWLWAVLTIPACSVLYALGGDDNYASVWRDLGCALVMSVVLILATGNLLFLGAGVAIFGLLTIGLGLPDPPDRPDPDEGSLIGRIAWALAGRTEWIANIYTHAFLYASAWAIYFTASILRGVLFHA